MSEVKNRRQNVDVRTVLTVWESVANQVNEAGERTGTVSQAARELGMKKGSLIARVKDLRAKGLDLTDMPREKPGPRVSIDELKAMLTEVKASVVSETEESDVEESEASDETEEFEPSTAEVTEELPDGTTV